MTTTKIPGEARTPCVDCGQPIKIWPAEDGYDTPFRCGRCGHTALAAPVPARGTETSPERTPR